MTWLSATLPYVGGGVLGAAVTYGLTYVEGVRVLANQYNQSVLTLAIAELTEYLRRRPYATADADAPPVAD